MKGRNYGCCGFLGRGMFFIVETRAMLWVRVFFAFGASEADQRVESMSAMVMLNANA